MLLHIRRNIAPEPGTTRAETRKGCNARASPLRIKRSTREEGHQRMQTGDPSSDTYRTRVEKEPKAGTRAETSDEGYQKTEGSRKITPSKGVMEERLK